MYWFDSQQHKVPHFHVRYPGAEVVFDLSGNLLTGILGPRVNRLVNEWCAERKSELLFAWSKAIEGKEIPWIQPLR